MVEKEQYHNKDISSTSIREKISKGDMAEVNEMLDHPYSVIGRVEHGKQLGRTINFPTANIIPEAVKLLPPNGVYRTKVVINGEKFDSITNVGVNPTVESGKKIKVETNILDYEGDVYGEIIQVLFFDFIRPERTFSNMEELKQQIQRDTEKCRTLTCVFLPKIENIYFEEYDVC